MVVGAAEGGGVRDGGVDRVRVVRHAVAHGAEVLVHHVDDGPAVVQQGSVHDGHGDGSGWKMGPSRGRKPGVAGTGSAGGENARPGGYRRGGEAAADGGGMRGSPRAKPSSLPG